MTTNGVNSALFHQTFNPACGYAKLITIFTVSLLLSGWWTLACEANPLGRSKRETLSQLIDTTRLSNPCSVRQLDCSMAANDYDEVALNINLAKDRMETLQSLSGSPSLCSGMQLGDAIPTPAITNDMTKVNKLKELYKTLVHYTAYLMAITSQQNTNTQLKTNLDTSLGSLQNILCSLECKVEFTASERSSFISSATSKDYPTGQNRSRDNIYTCLISTQTIALLVQLLDTTTAP